MEQKLKTSLKFAFEELGDMPELNIPVKLDKKQKGTKIVTIVKPRKLTKDASTRLF